MSHLERSRTVALLIDYDNLQICAQRDAPGSDLDLRSVVALAQRYGAVVVARAYAEWNNPNERLEAYKAGIEPSFAPVLRTEGPNGRDGKSLADTVMVADGVDLMWSHAPDVFVLVTSDKDMIPLARLVKQRGARLVVLGSDLTAVPLREIADEFFTYRRLVQEVTGLLLGAQPSGRPASGRQARSRPAHAERPAPPSRPVVARPAAPPPVEEQPAQAVAAPVGAVAEEAADDHGPTSTSSRRRRRRGRGRSHGSVAAPAEPLAAEPPSAGEPLVVVDEISANGAIEPVSPPAAEEDVPALAAPAPPAQTAEPAEPADVAAAEPAQPTAESVEPTPAEEPQPTPPPRRRRRTATAERTGASTN